MARTKQISVLAVALLLLLSVSAPPAAWAQSDQPTRAAAWAQIAQPTRQEPSTGQKVAAGFSNVLYVPMKALVICPISGAGWLLYMVVTLGGKYDDAANGVKMGCGGKWVIKGEDIHFSYAQ